MWVFNKTEQVFYENKNREQISFFPLQNHCSSSFEKQKHADAFEQGCETQKRSYLTVKKMCHLLSL